MIRLDSTLRKLEILLGGAVATTQPVFMASWSDGSSSNYVGGATPGVTNNTTVVTLVAAPASGVVRDVDYLAVKNLDTATSLITIRYNDNGTTYALAVVSLNAGDKLVYTHANGWATFDSQGSIHTTGTAGSTGPAGGQAQAMLLDMPDDQDDRSLSYCGNNQNINVGVQTFTGLINIANSSAGQIKFPSVQNPSTDVNTLDDYSEGTWVPVMSFGGASIGITYTTQLGSYIKVGKLVCIWAHVRLSNKGSSTGSAMIAGLPFTTAADLAFYGGGMPFFGGTVAVVSAGCAAIASSTTVNLYNLPGTLIQDTNCTNASEFVLGLTYKSAA